MNKYDIQFMLNPTHREFNMTDSSTQQYKEAQGDLDRKYGSHSWTDAMYKKNEGVLRDEPIDIPDR